MSQESEPSVSELLGRLDDVEACIDAYYEWCNDLCHQLEELRKEKRFYAKRYYELEDRIHNEYEL